MAQEGRRGVALLRSMFRRFGLCGRRGPIALALAAIVCFGIVGALRLAQAGQTIIVRHEQGEAATEQKDVSDKEQSGQQQDANGDVLVHVDGAVAFPGVYLLTGSSPRVNDAVKMAGGLVEDADVSSINLASTVEDGQKIYVPRKGEVIEVSDVPNESSDTATVQQSDTGGSSSSRININTATADELKSLPGVGDATASAIVEDRNQNGNFASAEDLMRVSGIGQKKFDKMRDMICV